eukprot:5045007-Pyramimonas_sp.AAC.1
MPVATTRGSCRQPLGARWNAKLRTAPGGGRPALFAAATRRARIRPGGLPAMAEPHRACGPRSNDPSLTEPWSEDP